MDRRPYRATGEPGSTSSRRSSTTSCGGWRPRTCAASGRARRCRRRRSCTRRICGWPAPARRGTTSGISSASPRARCGRFWSSARARAARRSDGAGSNRVSLVDSLAIAARPRKRCCRRSTRRSTASNRSIPSRRGSSSCASSSASASRRPPTRWTCRRRRSSGAGALARAWLFRELSDRPT